MPSVIVCILQHQDVCAHALKSSNPVPCLNQSSHRDFNLFMSAALYCLCCSTACASSTLCQYLCWGLSWCLCLLSSRLLCLEVSLVTRIRQECPTQGELYKLYTTITIFSKYQGVHLTPGPCTTKQVLHTRDQFLLSYLTKPHNRNRARQYHNGGYQLLNSNQVSPLERWTFHINLKLPH